MSTVYSPLPQHGPDVDEKEEHTLQRGPAQLSPRQNFALIFLGTSLLISLSANAVLAYRQLHHPWELRDALPSQFAHLRRDVPTEIVESSDFASLDRTIQDAAWNNIDVEPWNGFLALPESYAMSQNLPHSQRWPWDSSKGVYIMTSSHELHCVRVLRIFVNENHDSIPREQLTWQYPHVMHCLDLLRESVMCNADDTPLYIGRLHKNVLSNHPRAGTGTVKMCRDWNKILQWSRERSACYRPVHWGEEGFDEVERYKFCPDGARPWEDGKMNVRPKA